MEICPKQTSERLLGDYLQESLNHNTTFLTRMTKRKPLQTQGITKLDIPNLAAPDLEADASSAEFIETESENSTIPNLQRQNINL